ncbi:hypothetical protein [Polymorphospora rubra]|uniref:Uncharacterized protein n=1 Tax=Polymorphospora rubra TaxID=338584 RepID=A0A810N805_9ACTN|nr:hypothetical protein [Polymorphospora rubra]BCJ69951.1 hypothetical protein Prubr_69720 [Polymorphospora rubra]
MRVRDLVEPVEENDADLVTVLQSVLEHSWRMDAYAREADRAGDAELAGWLRRIRDDSARAGDQGKVLLAHRLDRDGG